MTNSYVLSAAAEADLRAIIRYTRREWGNAGVRSYIAKLEQGIERLVAGKGPLKRVYTLHPNLRVARCEHHFIFCLPRENSPTLIIAIFHERMDLMARLADRLE